MSVLGGPGGGKRTAGRLYHRDIHDSNGVADEDATVDPRPAGSGLLAQPKGEMGGRRTRKQGRGEWVLGGRA